LKERGAATIARPKAIARSGRRGSKWAIGAAALDNRFLASMRALADFDETSLMYHI
jgi:hypothetical protein